MDRDFALTRGERKPLCFYIRVMRSSQSEKFSRGPTKTCLNDQRIYPQMKRNLATALIGISLGNMRGRIPGLDGIRPRASIESGFVPLRVTLADSGCFHCSSTNPPPPPPCTSCSVATEAHTPPPYLARPYFILFLFAAAATAAAAGPMCFPSLFLKRFSCFLSRRSSQNIYSSAGGRFLF